MSGLSIVLAVGLLAFVGVASAVLLWDGLSEVSHGEVAAHPRARARLVAGAVGFAVALWLAIGLLTHAH